MNDANWKITKHHPKDDKLKEKKLLNLSSFLQIKN